MNSRYEVAMLYKEHWPLLSWKGDDHTSGIYFDDEYGYLVERTYAVRIEHEEPAPPVFYVPAFEEEQDDEVLTEFPYKEMVKKPNKYHYLFAGKELQQEELKAMFKTSLTNSIEMDRDRLMELLQFVPKKRERDRSWLVLKRTERTTTAMIIQKKSEVYEVVRKMEIENEYVYDSNMIYVSMNANNVLHALNLFSFPGSVSFSKSHDRIILTSGASIPRVEAIISLPKEQIQREIECRSYN